MTNNAPRWQEYMDVDQLPDAAVNPKGHDEPALDASIERFGFIEPIVLDERTGRLLGGHGRRDDLRAKKEAGDEPPEGIVIDDEGRWLAPVARGWSSKDDDEAEAAAIALNRIGEIGGWKDDELAAVLARMADTPLGLDGLGFDDGDLKRMLSGTKMPDLDTTAKMNDGMEYRVLIVCENERQQTELLGRFEKEGLVCQALIA